MMAIIPQGLFMSKQQGYSTNHSSFNCQLYLSKMEKQEIKKCSTFISIKIKNNSYELN